MQQQKEYKTVIHEKMVFCVILAASIASSLAASLTATIACLVLGNNPRSIYANEKYNECVSMEYICVQMTTTSTLAHTYYDSQRVPVHTITGILVVRTKMRAEIADEQEECFS